MKQKIVWQLFQRMTLYMFMHVRLLVLAHCSIHIKEGDGERVLMIWKYLLVIFNSSRLKDYTKEA